METNKSKEGSPHREGEKSEMPLDRLVKTGEWMKLQNNVEYQELSLEGKIITAVDAIDVRIKQMEKIFSDRLVADREGAKVILDKTIKPMRNLKNALGARLVGEFVKKNDADNVSNVLGIDQSTQPRQTTLLKKAA